MGGAAGSSVNVQDGDDVLAAEGDSRGAQAMFRPVADGDGDEERQDDYDNAEPAASAATRSAASHKSNKPTETAPLLGVQAKRGKP